MLLAKKLSKIKHYWVNNKEFKDSCNFYLETSECLGNFFYTRLINCFPDLNLDRVICVSLFYGMINLYKTNSSITGPYYNEYYRLGRALALINE